MKKKYKVNQGMTLAEMRRRVAVAHDRVVPMIDHKMARHRQIERRAKAKMVS